MAMLTSSKPSLASTIEVIEEVDLSIPLREPLSPTTYDSEKGTNATSAISSLSASSPPSNLVLTTISSFTLTLSTWGFYNSTGILLSHLSIHNLPDTSLPILSLIPALNILLTLLLFLPLGPIYDTYGPLPLLIPGSLIYILSLALLSFCSSLLHFLLVYGVLSALGMSPLCTVANAMLNTFEGTGYRGLATGIALVGNPTGGIIFTFVLKAVLENLEWADAIRIVAGIVGILVAVGFLAFLPRGGSRKSRVGNQERNGDCDVSTTTTDTRNETSWWKFWHEKKIDVFEFVLVGTTGLLPTYALKQGFSTSVSFNVVAIVNAGSILGRLLSGPLSDHLGPYNIVLLCLVSISLLSNFIFFLPTSILPIPSTPTPTPTPTPSSPSTPQILLYLYATLSGLGSGAIMSCAPLCISALCPSNVYARWWGASQLGVAIA
ncbi:hypothetical protein sscle_02g020000 [Sclerotinia sclerotiorum 1980 UF-70]|uniref:Major facilitator superfamily (MFS) profile domain-containing protein n=1 Tax=Sclerotinia sclerotiorum (strain ATCC 18683 / 1980 / Ss-1) TaxID=665079 RepID=A0A1D9PX18_SCLS1|nr:hypothetical protein sscle_02g020000 [Sclerotinia sclerotiorum 1980 UF-70]